MLIALVLNAGLVFGAAIPAVVYAQNTTNLECGASGNITGTGTCGVGDADTKINNTVARAIRIFQIIVGLISVFMLIFGGLKYITSGGESSNVQGAKNTILYAAIGLVVVGLAQVIVSFVLNRVDNADSGTGV